MKKLFSLVLALSLLLCMAAQAESPFVSREVDWPITTEDVTITVMGPKPPCTWNGRKWIYGNG